MPKSAKAAQELAAKNEIAREVNLARLEGKELDRERGKSLFQNNVAPVICVRYAVGTVYLISMGVLAIAVALWLQGGIWGTIRRKLGADLFPVRRRLVE